MSIASLRRYLSLASSISRLVKPSLGGNGYAASSTYALQTVGLNVYYGGRKILDNVNLAVPRNTVFAIMGPSGSGKSTLLRVFNRLVELAPNARVEGRVLLFGRNIYDPSVDPMEVRRQVGMVFQNPNPFPHLSIYDNVALGPRLNGLARNGEELDRLVEWALRKAALWDEVRDRLHEPATRLSGGQQQRLCIARAIALKPRVLLMDEPTANLDPESSRRIEQLIVELRDDVTVVVVTHSPGQAARISDHVAFLFSGRIVEVGPTREVFTRPRSELTERFITGALG